MALSNGLPFMLTLYISENVDGMMVANGKLKTIAAYMATQN